LNFLVFCWWDVCIKIKELFVTIPYFICWSNIIFYLILMCLCITLIKNMISILLTYTTALAKTNIETTFDAISNLFYCVLKIISHWWWLWWWPCDYVFFCFLVKCEIRLWMLFFRNHNTDNLLMIIKITWKMRMRRQVLNNI
jgi:hypothetical protein